MREFDCKIYIKGIDIGNVLECLDNWWTGNPPVLQRIYRSTCSSIRTSRSKLSFRVIARKERRISFRMFDHVIISCTQGKYISFVDGGNPRMVHPLPPLSGWRGREGGLVRIMLFQSGESSPRLSTWNPTRAYRCGHVSLLSEFGPQGLYRLHHMVVPRIRKR